MVQLYKYVEYITLYIVRQLRTIYKELPIHEAVYQNVLDPTAKITASQESVVSLLITDFVLVCMIIRHVYCSLLNRMYG